MGRIPSLASEKSPRGEAIGKGTCSEERGLVTLGTIWSMGWTQTSVVWRCSLFKRGGDC